MDRKLLLQMISGGDRRSPVFGWLDEHYLEIVEGRGDQSRIAWVDLAAYMAANGILDGHGKPPTARRLAWTWQAVKRFRTGRSGSCRKAERAESPVMPVQPIVHAIPAPESKPTAARPPALRRRRQFEEEPPPVRSDEEVLEELADLVDSLETGDSWKKPPNVHREKLIALRAAKAAALTEEKNEPT